MDLAERLARTIEDLRRGERAAVAIDGPDAAGKTTLARQVTERLNRPAVLASIDAWHHPRDVRLRRGHESAEGYYRDSFDYVALTSWLLDPFGSGSAVVRTSGFDYRRDQPSDSRREVEADAVLVMEGVFLLRPELRSHWDLTVYLHVPEDVTLSRAVARDLDQFGTEPAVVRRYERRYLPGQALYRAESDPLNGADIVIDNSDPKEPGVVRWMRAGG